MPALPKDTTLLRSISKPLSDLAARSLQIRQSTLSNKPTSTTVNPVIPIVACVAVIAFIVVVVGFLFYTRRSRRVARLREKEAKVHGSVTYYERSHELEQMQRPPRSSSVSKRNAPLPAPPPPPPPPPPPAYSGPKGLGVTMGKVES